ncbi:MAG: ArsB/NhaD family transporter [Deltaproteobacteria bacterium]|nr:ArsB/NhaD family transporter [Deltaproteobacteria bacterium]MBW2099822.1 ArsB/NhaD family transporter [Deltaproteobacteria bacterium]
MENALIPIIVFLLVYIALTFELINKAVAALFGVAIVVMLRIVSAHHAVTLIDFETIMLLMGMMIIVSLLRSTGLFTLISVKIAELTQGSPLKILVLFSVVTAMMSAFLDNVTTVLIIIPIIIELTKGMGLDPKIFVISQALISNVGGTATLIGDPPNIIIGSKVGLTFNQFILNLSLPVSIIFIAVVFYIWAVNRKKFQPINTDLVKIFSFQLLLEKIRFEFMDIKLDKKLMTKALSCLGLAILLFTTQTLTKISPGVVALSVAMLLLIMSRADVEQVLEEVEWGTLLFFSGLFILVGVLEEHGVIDWIAENIFMKVGDNPYVIVLMVLWVAGIVSGFLDNIPFTVTMIPIIEHILESNPIPNNILWWALSLGACLGGNFTYIGASANIVAIGISKKYKSGISFFEFMKVSVTVTLISLLLASLYLMGYLWISLQR